MWFFTQKWWKFEVIHRYIKARYDQETKLAWKTENKGLIGVRFSYYIKILKMLNNKEDKISLRFHQI